MFWNKPIVKRLRNIFLTTFLILGITYLIFVWSITL